jgi:hypothetical protein
MKIIKNNTLSFFTCLLLSMSGYAELVAIDESDLNSVSGQAGITLNAKIVLGDETGFVYTNTSGKTEAAASAAETSYLVVDKISGEIEMKGLQIDLISDLNNSGKPAIQWTLPKEIKFTNLKTTGIYASSTEAVDSRVGHANRTSTFLVAANVNGTLAIPDNTQISVFVVD